MTNERPVSEQTLHVVSSADFSQKSPFKQFVGSLFGFDFFISYRWADARDYAVELAERLELGVDGKRYSCFLDSHDSPFGDDLKQVGKDALERTSILIVVGSPEAHSSTHVHREVSLFKERSKRIIPIEFVDVNGNGTFDASRYSSALQSEIAPDILRIKNDLKYRTDPANQLAGPSEEVIAQISGSFDLITQEDKRARVFGIAALVFGIVAILATVFWRTSETNFNEAERQRIQAQVQRDRAFRMGYVTTVNFAQRAWNDSRDVSKVIELLDQCRPESTGGTDHRGVEWYYLRRLASAEQLHISGSIDATSNITFSSDSRLLAWATGNVVNIWDVTESKMKVSFVAHSSQITSVAFHHDAKKLLTSSVDKSVRTWDSASGKETGKPLLHERPVYCATYSPNGRWIVTSTAKSICLWNADTRQALYPDKPADVAEFALLPSAGPLLPGDNGQWIAFSNNGKRLAVAGMTIRVWAFDEEHGGTSNDRWLDIPNGHAWSNVRVEFEPTNDSRLMSFDGSQAKLWDANSGELIARFQTEGEELVEDSTLSPDGTQLALVRSNVITVWDVATKNLRLTLRDYDSFRVVRAAFRPDRRQLATLAYDGSVKLWDITVGTEQHLVPLTETYADGAHFIEDGERLAIVSIRNESTGLVTYVEVWDSSGNEKLHEYIANAGPSPFAACAFSNCGKQLVTFDATSRGSLRFASTGEIIRTFGTSEGLAGDLDETGVRQIAVSSNGRYAAIVHGFAEFDGSKPSSVVVWDTRDGRQVARFDSNAGQISAVTFAHDGTSLALAGPNDHITSWDMRTNHHISFIPLPCRRYSRTAYSPDGRLLVAGNDEGRIVVVSSTSRNTMVVLRGHTKTITSLVFAPDGRRLASSDDAGTIVIWDTRTWREVLTFRARGPAKSLSFSPDGRQLCSTVEDGVRIWDGSQE